MSMKPVSMASTPGKKRKRESNASIPTPDTLVPTHDASVPTPAEVRLLATENTAFIPIVAATPGVQIPPDAKLAAYSRPRETKRSRSKPGYAVEYIIHGTTGRIDYEGREPEEDMEVERHYVGIYDPVTGDVEMYPAPRVLIRREIRSLREKNAELAKRNTTTEYYSARAALGGEFGSKKSKKAIERRDLNKINVNEMDASITTSIVSHVGENIESMPTKQDLEKEHIKKRLLPPHRTEGITSPAQIYNLDDVVSKDELDLVFVRDWVKGAEAGKRIDVLDNSHVTQRIAILGLAKSPSHEDIKKLKILRYISFMRNLYMFLSNHKLQHLLLKGKEIEMCRLLAIPRDILPILLKKYTEIISSPDPGGINETKEDWNPSRRASPTHLTKLLNYMAILCLFVEENWQVDVFYLKDDLGLQTREALQIFKNVGCRGKELTHIQAEALGIPRSQAKLHKIAALTAKPEFPKPRVMKRSAKK